MKDELFALIKEEWQKLNVEYLSKLYESMPRRMCCLIKK